MKFNRRYLWSLALIPSLHLSAQSELSGRVTDKDRTPVAEATVLLLNPADSTYITGTLSDVNGRFELLNLPPATYLLSVSRLGSKKVNLTRQIRQNTKNELGNIVLEEDAYLLSAVTVTGKRAPIQVTPGKTILHLSSILLSTDGNLLDALRKLPGVIVQNDGTLILNGQSGAKVLIDDKLTYLSGENLLHYLRSVPANSVETVELISQPSSQYDASGSSGMIHIVKKKIKEQGLLLTLSSSLERGMRTRGNENVTLHFRHNRWDVNTTYAYYGGKDKIDLSVSGHYLDPATWEPLDLRKDFTSDIERRNSGNYLKTELTYDVSDKITIGTYFSPSWLHRHKKELTLSDFFNPHKITPHALPSDSTLTALSHIHSNYANFTGGTDFVYKFAKTGKGNIAFDYQLFDQDDNQLLASSFQRGVRPLQEDTLCGKATNDVRLYSIQTNGNYAPSEKFSLMAGLKSVFVTIGSHALYKNRLGEIWQEDLHLSSRFAYKETIHAGYFQVNSRWSARFSTEIGLRLENTYTRSAYRAARQDTAFQKKYTHLFPRLTARYRLCQQHSFSIGYSRRIVRPDYRNMNPFVEVKDQFLYEQGNTELKPELIDNLEVSWLLGTRYAFQLFYTHRRHPISLSFLVEDNSRVRIMPLNLALNQACGFKAGLNNLRLFTWWTAHLNGSLTYKGFRWMTAGKTFSNKIVTPMLHLNNQFTFPYGWGGEATGYYSGTMREGQTRIKPLWTLSLGIRKDLWNNKFSLYIYAHDLFHTQRPRVNVDSNYLYYTSKEKNDSRMIGVSVSYRFHRGGEVKKTSASQGIEESKRIGLSY